MKPRNLLRFLPRSHSQASTVGFTIVELVVVVLMIGILSAIAAPGWNAFINRQRTRSVNDLVFQALRKAQSQAKFNKESRTIEFRYETTTTNDPPRFHINNKDPDESILDDDLFWQSLGANSEIKAGMVKLVVKECQTKKDDGTCTTYKDDEDNKIQFNYLGAVETDELNQELPFAVTVSTANNGFKRCVIVETLLGGMRTAEGKFDSNTGIGCPFDD